MPKICNKCGQEKESKEFSPKANEKDGLQRTCKECRNAAKRKVLAALEALTESYCEPEAEPDARMQTREPSVGPCARCEKPTLEWSPLNPYKDLNDEVHLCPTCKEHITFRWEGIWHLEVVMYRSPEEKEQWDQQKAKAELRELKDQIARENLEIDKIDPEEGVTDPNDPPEVQAADLARWRRTQAEMQDEAPSNLD